jgi:hypothetical protein
MAGHARWQGTLDVTARSMAGHARWQGTLDVTARSMSRRGPASRLPADRPGDLQPGGIRGVLPPVSSKPVMRQAEAVQVSPSAAAPSLPRLVPQG